MSMRKIYIADIRGHVIDDKITGHIVPVAKNYKKILCNDYDVKIAAGPAILKSFKEEECLVLPHNISNVTLKDKFFTFINFIYLLQKTRGFPIIIQQSTTITSFLAIILFYWWTSPLYMIQYNTEAVNTWWKRVLNRFVQMKLTGTICPTERIGKAYGARYCVVPDYFYAKESKNIIPFDEKKWDIGIVGGITANKGTLEAARYLANKNVKVLIAGRICEEGLEEPLKDIVTGCENIELRIGFLSDEDYHTYIKESKYCLLNYRGTYFDRSSGVVLDAIYNGTPVIGTRCEALKMVEENNIGITYDSIEELCIDEVFDSRKYSIYTEGIREFCDKQYLYVDNLLAFLD